MIIKAFGEANIEEISIFEMSAGIKLPNDYIDFLLKYNGGSVELTIGNAIHIEDLGEDINIDILFGIKTKEPELSVEVWLNDYRNDMLQGSIIIGTSYQHGFIILIRFGEYQGVYYWDHTFSFEQSNEEHNTYFIANSFQEFIDQIK